MLLRDQYLAAIEALDTGEAPVSHLGWGMCTTLDDAGDDSDVELADGGLRHRAFPLVAPISSGTQCALLQRRYAGHTQVHISFTHE